MSVGLDLSLGLSRSDTSVLNPATTSATGYWLDYAGAPWTGTASAGSSGGRTLVVGSAPAVGANFGTHPSADFNGAANNLVTAITADNYFSAGGGTIDIVVEMDVLAASAANAYDEPALWGKTGAGHFLVSVSANGVRASNLDASFVRTTTGYVAISTGTKYCVQAKWNGTNLMIRVNGGAWASVASGPAGFLSANTCDVGVNYDGTKLVNGRIARILTYSSALSDATLDALYASARASFGVS